MRVVTIVILLVLSACGGSSDHPTPPKSSAKITPKATTKPTTAAPTGKSVPEALSRFRCAKNSKNVWNAGGYLTNSSKNQQTFQVTVYVGAPNGGEEKARTKQVPGIAPGGSVKFTVTRIPAPKSGGPCHVQVLATD